MEDFINLKGSIEIHVCYFANWRATYGAKHVSVYVILTTFNVILSPDNLQYGHVTKPYIDVTVM